MGFLIDTNVLSEPRKGSKMDKNVRAWFDSVSSEGKEDILANQLIYILINCIPKCWITFQKLTASPDRN